MRFTVEVEDFYIEEGELATELQHQLKSSIVREIREEIKDKVKSFTETHIRQVINEGLQARVQVLMDEIISSGKLKGEYSSDPEITVEEMIRQRFLKARPDITKTVESKVKSHVKDLQDRYDLMFATQLITKIKEQGFLKQEAVDMLLGEKGNS